MTTLKTVCVVPRLLAGTSTTDLRSAGIGDIAGFNQSPVKTSEKLHVDAYAAREPGVRRHTVFVDVLSEHPARFLVADNVEPTEEELLKVRELAFGKWLRPWPSDPRHPNQPRD